MTQKEPLKAGRAVRALEKRGKRGCRRHEGLLGRERRIARGGQQLLFRGGRVGGWRPGPEGPQEEQGKCPNPVLVKGYRGLTNMPGGWTATLGNRQAPGSSEEPWRVSPLIRAPTCARPYAPWLCPHSRVQHPARSIRGKERAPGSRGWQREGQVTPALGGRAPSRHHQHHVPGDTGPAPAPQRWAASFSVTVRKGRKDGGHCLPCRVGKDALECKEVFMIVFAVTEKVGS